MKAAFTDRVSGLILWIISLFLFQSWYSVNAQMLPGGVFGAEVWYIASDREVSENIFTDHSQYPLLIERCTNEEITSGLLNFNPSVFSESLCLSYRAPLESLYHKNIFVVAEPDDDVSNALFHSNLESFGSYIPPAGVYSENTFIIETHKGYLTGTSPFFESYQNAHVYYYDSRWERFGASAA